MKICSLYGAGFYFIPGTDTCVKLGGYIRADMGINTNLMFAGNTTGAAAAQNRLGNAFTWRSREDLTIDTRTATEYGVVRTFFETVFTWTSGGYAGLGTGATAYNAAPPGTSGNGAVSGGQLGVYYAFIQFAGFTMGKAASQFSTPWGNYLGNNLYDGLVGGGGSAHGREPVHLYGRVRQRRVGLDRCAGSERVLPGWHSKPRGSADRYLRHRQLWLRRQ